MRGYEIARIIRNNPLLKSHFYGIFSIEFVKHLNDLPVLYFAIVNISKHGEEGLHWFLIFRDVGNTFEIFNSQGVQNLRAFVPYVFFALNHLDFATFRYNRLRYQSPASVTCGFYCIFYAFQRLQNLTKPYSSLLRDIFSNNVNRNEALVRCFFNHGPC